MVIFALGFISALNISILVFNIFMYKHSKNLVKSPEKSNNDVEKSTEKTDNGNIYEFSKSMDILNEYLNGGEDERGR